MEAEMKCSICGVEKLVEFTLEEDGGIRAVALTCKKMVREDGTPVDEICNQCHMGLWCFKGDWNILLDAIRWVEDNEGLGLRDWRIIPCIEPLVEVSDAKVSKNGNGG